MTVRVTHEVPYPAPDTGLEEARSLVSVPTILLAPDSFKGTMSAQVVASALAEGAKAAGVTAVRCPLADGGEGTAEVLRAALGGRPVPVRATGPLGAPVDATYLLTDDGQTAVVETASASGLNLVPVSARDAEAASSHGTGELLAAAAASGAQRILLGVGGSACTDGGAGALAALAAAGGLRGARLVILCDVQTPFERAAEVFAPQKGAAPAAVERLTARLNRLAAGFRRDPRGRPRTGAAGGLSGALWATYEAELVSGIDTVLELCRFDRLLTAADAVITGEGQLDAQTAHGKVIDGVTRWARKAGVPVWATVGRCLAGRAELAQLGLAGVRTAGEPAALRDAAGEIATSVAAGRNSRRDEQ
jgi:glycerate kinase